MMPDNNPFLEGYKSAILGKSDVCPYEEGSAESERWCRGFGRKAVVIRVAAARPHNNSVLEGRRPFVEGYKSAILGSRDICPYEEGTTEFERWWKGFHGWAGARGIAASKPIISPLLEGRRPFVEGYKSAIVGKSDVCPYDENSTDSERWWQGFRQRAGRRIASRMSAHAPVLLPVCG